MSCACQAFASVHCCLVVPGLQKADIFIGSRLCCLIAFFVTFLCGILGQVWYLIVSISIFVALFTFF